VSERSKVRVYIACSLDGFVAGKDDDLSWLEPSGDPEKAPPTDPGAVDFTGFMSGVGALLMGRRTYDVVRGFGGELPYGDTPMLIATHRELEDPGPTVRTVSGSIEEVVAEAQRVAAGRDVYVDGGTMVRQALDAGLIDDLLITVVPHVLGEGISLFAGCAKEHRLEFTGHHRYGELVQLHARPLAR
jgi:dihydrofolate reductase